MSRDARRSTSVFLLTAALALLAPAAVSAANYTTANFVVTAPTQDFAQQVGDLAEKYRDDIAMEWLGRKLPRWYKPCPIVVKVGQIGAGGATTFCFDRGEVFGWRMNIQGSEERILDSVLPHEVSHTIFASHFRRPLPRWADEGAATLVEHESERRRQTNLLNQVIRTSQRIPLAQLLQMKEYPKDMQQVLTLYAEGYSLAEFFVQQGGRARFLQFLEDAHRRNWDEALKKHYDFAGVSALEKTWSQWVVAGSPPLPRRDGTQLAQNEPKGRPAADNALIRSQSPDEADERGAREPDRNLASRSNPRSGSLEAPDPRSRRRDDSSRASAAASPKNDGWVEQERRPRPAPLVARIEFQTMNARGDATTRREPVNAPPFEDEDNAERLADEPPFESDDVPLGGRTADARALPDVVNTPETDFSGTPEDSSETGFRSPDRSASPRALPGAGVARNGSSPSPFSP